jgi:hypothetical protein
VTEAQAVARAYLGLRQRRVGHAQAVGTLAGQLGVSKAAVKSLLAAAKQQQSERPAPRRERTR